VELLLLLRNINSKLVEKGLNLLQGYLKENQWLQDQKKKQRQPGGVNVQLQQQQQWHWQQGAGTTKSPLLLLCFLLLVLHMPNADRDTTPRSPPFGHKAPHASKHLKKKTIKKIYILYDCLRCDVVFILQS